MTHDATELLKENAKLREALQRAQDSMRYVVDCGHADTAFMDNLRFIGAALAGRR